MTDDNLNLSDLLTRRFGSSENVKVTRNAELSALYAVAVANIVHVTLKDGKTRQRSRLSVR